MTDIIVALILAGITLYLADIGMGVSLISLSDAEKSRVRTKFRVLLLVSLVLIAAQGMRTYTAQMQAEVEQKRREQSDRSFALLLTLIARDSAETKTRLQRPLEAIIRVDPAPTGAAPPTPRASSGAVVFPSPVKSTNALTSPSPLTEGFRIVQREVPSKCEGAPYASRVTLQAERVFANPTLEVTTDAPIERWGMTPWPIYMAFNPTPNTIRITLMSPALSPDTPVWMAVCSKQPIRITDVSLAH